MNRLREQLFRSAKRKDGQSMVEYGLIISLIAVAVLTSLGLLGNTAFAWYTALINAINGVAGG